MKPTRCSCRNCSCPGDSEISPRTESAQNHGGRCWLKHIRGGFLLGHPLGVHGVHDSGCLSYGSKPVGYLLGTTFDEAFWGLMGYRVLTQNVGPRIIPAVVAMPELPDSPCASAEAACTEGAPFAVSRDLKWLLFVLYCAQIQKKHHANILCCDTGAGLRATAGQAMRGAKGKDQEWSHLAVGTFWGTTWLLPTWLLPTVRP